jgi:hypothetical protein
MGAWKDSQVTAFGSWHYAHYGRDGKTGLSPEEPAFIRGCKKPEFN